MCLASTRWELRSKAVGLAPAVKAYWHTLGGARVYAKDWAGAVAALEKAMELSSGGGEHDWFFLAVAHWELGAKEEARAWYDKAIAWMDENDPQNDELILFRAEAEELLGLSTPTAH